MPRFLYPPHPISAMKIRPPTLCEWSLQRLEDEEGDWVAQRKYNGSHMVAWVHGDEVALWNRSGEPFTLYKLTEDMRRCFASLNLGGAESVLDGELLHTKAKSKITGFQAVTNTIVLYDVLYLGKHLLTETYPERYAALVAACRNPETMEPKGRALEVCRIGESSLWLAETFTDEFVYRFYEMYEFDKAGNDKFPEIEGLVCKRTGRTSALKLGTKKYDVNWMMRVRKTKEKIYLW